MMGSQFLAGWGSSVTILVTPEVYHPVRQVRVGRRDARRCARQLSSHAKSARDTQLARPVHFTRTQPENRTTGEGDSHTPAWLVTSPESLRDSETPRRKGGEPAFL